MFGLVFGGAPFIKGVMMNKFADPEALSRHQENTEKISDLEQALDYSMDSSDSTGQEVDVNTESTDSFKPIKKETKQQKKKREARIEEISNQIAELKGENETILNSELSKLSNLEKAFVEPYLDLLNKEQELTQRGRVIENDDGLSRTRKNKLQEKINFEITNVRDALQKLRDPKVFGSAWNTFVLVKNKMI